MENLRIHHVFSTPLGEMRAELDEQDALIRLAFIATTESSDISDSANAPSPGCAEVSRQITEYFLGQRREFDLKLASNGTEFQKRVWKELCQIPCGQTLSYAQLAQRLGNPAAVRAVAGANAANPICIVIPCHRVIGSHGELTGYAYGCERKKALLELEGALALPKQGLLFFDPNHCDEIDDK